MSSEAEVRRRWREWKWVCSPCADKLGIEGWRCVHQGPYKAHGEALELIAFSVAVIRVSVWEPERSLNRRAIHMMKFSSWGSTPERTWWAPLEWAWWRTVSFLRRCFQ